MQFGFYRRPRLEGKQQSPRSEDKMSILLFCLSVSISTRKKERPGAVVYTLRRCLASIIKSNLKGGGVGLLQTTTSSPLKGVVMKSNSIHEMFFISFQLVKSNLFPSICFADKLFVVTFCFFVQTNQFTDKN